MKLILLILQTFGYGELLQKKVNIRVKANQKHKTQTINDLIFIAYYEKVSHNVLDSLLHCQPNQCSRRQYQV